MRAGRRVGWMAERSKALVSGTSLFGGEGSNPSSVTMSRLAQLVERKTLNLVVVGSSPTVGASRNPDFIFFRAAATFANK